MRKTQFCRRTKKNVVFPEGRSSNDKTVAFKNCKIDKGDLGAGLIDSNGAVTGLVWGSEKRTGEYDRFMSGKAGRSLMYSSPLSCIVNSFPELFPGYEIEDTVKEECEVQRSRNTIGQFFKTLTEIFLTKKQQVVSKVINISHRNRTSKSFYKIDHPECISNIYDDIEACEFYPSLYTSYEIRRKNIDRCYKTKRIKSRIEKTLFGDFDLDIYIDGNFYLTFTLPSCH
ncbi:hypothetical protein [Bacteriovorax sp. DB6_IX]|uniref:hypothetical protein n=1 Tax=Bacteriovorax sp. DB6_IX TaxID=1353530 RepID=UPI00038A01D0|nr:hypothetical protein [Bacteriovorax sp. DB6_IX]EQC52486.1 hypothetical protein M901_1903 [Bacteriovorax sp. DB6_IX]